jgi:hypothetical protein
MSLKEQFYPFPACHLVLLVEGMWYSIHFTKGKNTSSQHTVYRHCNGRQANYSFAQLFLLSNVQHGRMAHVLIRSRLHVVAESVSGHSMSCCSFQWHSTLHQEQLPSSRLQAPWLVSSQFSERPY